MFAHNTDMNSTQTVISNGRPSIGQFLAGGTCSSVLVQHVLSSLMYAAAGALFYKRSFNKSMFPTLGTLLCLGIFAERFTQTNAFFTLACLLVMMARIISVSGTAVASNSYKTFVVVLFLALLDIRCALSESRIPYWIRVYPTAIAQFIRRPVWLKSKLQSMRSKLGPLYVLYVSCTAMQSGQASVFLRCLAFFAMAAANVAGVCFRPDNKSIIDQFYSGTTLAWRRYYHGRLMLLSLVAITVFVCLQVTTEESPREILTASHRLND